MMLDFYKFQGTHLMFFYYKLFLLQKVLLLKSFPLKQLLHGLCFLNNCFFAADKFSFSVITIEKRLMEIWLSENLNKFKKRVNTIWIY